MRQSDWQSGSYRLICSNLSSAVCLALKSAEQLESLIPDARLRKLSIRMVAEFAEVAERKDFWLRGFWIRIAAVSTAAGIP
jgi:hypothetical protein